MLYGPLLGSSPAFNKPELRGQVEASQAFLIWIGICILPFLLRSGSIREGYLVYKTDSHRLAKPCYLHIWAHDFILFGHFHIHCVILYSYKNKKRNGMNQFVEKKMLTSLNESQGRVRSSCHLPSIFILKTWPAPVEILCHFSPWLCWMRHGFLPSLVLDDGKDGCAVYLFLSLPRK